MARQGDAEAISELEAQPEFPQDAAYLWTIWVDLSRTRGSTGMGPARITRGEIRLWEEDEHHQLDRWERRLILDLDTVWWKAINRKDGDAAD